MEITLVQVVLYYYVLVVCQNKVNSVQLQEQQLEETKIDEEPESYDNASATAMTIDDERNSISNLSLRDIFEIQQIWTPLYADASSYGIELFKRLFHKNPDIKSYFKQFRNLDDDQLSQSTELRAHVIKFMSAFNMAILHLKEPELVIAMMNKLGESHNRRRVKVKHFEALREVLLQFLMDDLKLSESEIDSWTRFIDFIFRHIIEKLEEN